MLNKSPNCTSTSLILLHRADEDTEWGQSDPAQRRRGPVPARTCQQRPGCQLCHSVRLQIEGDFSRFRTHVQGDDYGLSLPRILSQPGENRTLLLVERLIQSISQRQLAAAQDNQFLIEV